MILLFSVLAAVLVIVSSIVTCVALGEDYSRRKMQAILAAGAIVGVATYFYLG